MNKLIITKLSHGLYIKTRTIDLNWNLPRDLPLLKNKLLITKQIK